MNIELNGDKKSVDDGLNITALLEKFGIQSDRVVVELNKEIINSEQFTTIQLAESDSIEVIQFVPGG